MENFMLASGTAQVLYAALLNNLLMTSQPSLISRFDGWMTNPP